MLVAGGRGIGPGLLAGGPGVGPGLVAGGRGVGVGWVGPGAAGVGYLYPQVGAVELGPDGELAAGPGGPAVLGGVAGQFGQAEDGVVGGWATVQQAGQEPPRLADLRRGRPGRSAPR